MVMVSWTSFLIAPECVPGRAGLLVTLLLVLTTISLHELDVSPSVQGITPLLIWNDICVTMVIVAIVEYAGILYTMRFCTRSKHTEQNHEFNMELNKKDCGLIHPRKKAKLAQVGDDQYHKKNNETRFKIDGYIDYEN